ETAELRYVYEVVDGIGNHMQDYRVIINKSTSPPGTSAKIKTRLQNILTQRNLATPFDVVSNPEFLKQGAAIEDFMHPDRIIIGVENERSKLFMEKLYHPIYHDKHKFIVMDYLSAELTKYAANVYLAARISFINEMSQLAEHFG